MEDEDFTREQAAARLGEDMTTLETWEEEIYGPAPKTVDGRTMYSADEVRRYEQQVSHFADM